LALMKLTMLESIVFGIGWILLAIATIGMLVSAQPIFTYFAFTGIAGLIMILLGLLIRHKRIQKQDLANYNHFLLLSGDFRP
jgi:hypothetical protein